ncbi:MAG: zinc ribbon domain-containing protein [Dehalococcoidia bacterium]
MPLYEYVCSECDNKFEVLRPLDQAENEACCPECQKSARRVMSTVSVFTTSPGGVPKTVPGSTGSSCASCSSGNCSTCAS